LAFPVVVSNLGLTAMGVVDLLFVGKLGAVAIGAVGLGTAIFSWFMILGIGLLSALDYLVSHADGAGKREEGAATLVQAVFLAIALALPLAGLVLGASAILGRLGVDAAVARETAGYLRVLAPSLLPLLVFVAFRQYLQARGSVRMAMFILLAANVLNAAANAAWVLGSWGFSPLGAQGSAWATLLSRVWMVGAIVVYAFYRDRVRDARLLAKAPWRLDRRRVLPILRLGWPSAVQMGLEVGVFSTATTLAARFSPPELAAHQVVLSIASATFMVPLGVGSAAAVLVGRSLGEGDRTRARSLGMRCFALGAGFMGFSSLALLIFPEVFLGAYTSDPAVVAAGASLLFIVALFQLSDGIQAVATGALRGLGDSRTPLIANFLGHWLVGLPAGALLGIGLGLRLTGIWIGLSVGLTLVAAGLFWRWLQSAPAK
jgi:MATE family multidrug resistance protein